MLNDNNGLSGTEANMTTGTKSGGVKRKRVMRQAEARRAKVRPIIEANPGRTLDWLEAEIKKVLGKGVDRNWLIDQRRLAQNRLARAAYQQAQAARPAPATSADTEQKKDWLIRLALDGDIGLEEAERYLRGLR